MPLHTDRRRFLIAGGTACLGILAGGGYWLLGTDHGMSGAADDRIKVVEGRNRPAVSPDPLPVPQTATVPPVSEPQVDEEIERRLALAAESDMAKSRQRMDRRRQIALETAPRDIIAGQGDWAP